MIEIKTLSEKVNLCTLITFTMKTGLYEKKFKKALNQLKLAKLINPLMSALLSTS